MVTSPNEWRILEWDEKLQTNKTSSKIQRTQENEYLLLIGQLSFENITINEYEWCVEVVKFQEWMQTVSEVHTEEW